MFSRRPLPHDRRREAHVVFVTRLVLGLLILSGLTLIIKGCPTALDATADVILGPQ